MRPAAAALAAAALLGGCAPYRMQSEAQCAAHQALGGLALGQLIALGESPPDRIHAGFVLCSVRENRLLAAAQALGSQGYSSYIGADRRGGKCLRVARTVEANAAALEREAGAMCRIAATHRIAFMRWGVDVGGKSATVEAGRVRVD